MFVKIYTIIKLLTKYGCTIFKMETSQTPHVLTLQFLYLKHKYILLYDFNGFYKIDYGSFVISSGTTQ